MNNFEKELAKAMTFCSKKEICIADLKEKFDRWQTNKDFHEKIISTLIAEKFIDEQRYATAFANDKLKYNNWGRNKIAFSLKQKKIAAPIISNALNNISTLEYNQIIKKLIVKKLKANKNEDLYKLKAKIYRYLVSKGFEPDFFIEKLNQELENKK